ncbi:carbonyl reductase [NADPH] 1-like [Paramacrobiotus metropolitanus]|uniref:carbonyl reductase [NADPH] 1-like n=1 Tax=Paramacrobiotus metropolitanus TaxID=2943436 RepID=UPI002445B6D4|nr:carbonyl reductase [NADPH] 1-like [Paramacrobiotus metropolitanus]
MASEVPIALVTGANKGIGLQIVRDLCRRFQGVVYLTARDHTRGQEAVEKLQNEGLHPKFLQMDVNDVKTINQVKKHIQDAHGGLDILVNNAGILMHSKTKEDFGKEAETIIATNFTGVVDVCDQLFPLLRAHARVVNVSSSLGSLNYLTNMQVRGRLVADDLTVSELKDIMAEYVRAAKKGDYKEHGYPGFPDAYGAYPMSKIGLTALTRVQQRMLDQEKPGMDIAVNAVHPGYVDTDMTNHQGHLTVQEGADTPVYCALLPKDKNIPRGQYLSHRKVVDWVNGTG